MKGVFEKKNNFDLIAFKTDGFLGFPPLFHPHCELIYVESGSVSMTVGGVERVVTKGETAFVFPYVTHSYAEAPDATVGVILFDAKITYFEALLLKNQPLSPFVCEKPELRLLFESVCRLHNEEDTEINKGAKGYLNAIIAELLPHLTLEKNDTVEIDTAKKVLEYCTEHFSENITVKGVSEALFVSQSYISKIFSKKLRYGFREYINLLRINKAKELLCTTDEKIIDVMLDVGFRNQSSFNRVFIGVTGASPRAYRKERSRLERTKKP